jgi:OOP family OmpA-OmpF porin
MKPLKSYICILSIGLAAFAFQSCKSKKLIQKPATAADTETKPVAQPTPPPPPPAPAPKPVAPAPPDYNFTNIQFDFNSSVLRTDGIQYLDHVVSEMKKDPSTKFKLNGNASSEGTAEHNMVLSKDRAASVKQYLTNAGIDASRLITKGYGAKKPIASNDTEEGREKNRRVEIKIVN